MRNIRLLAIDIDGTLLDDEGELPPENVAAIRAVHEAGVHVVLCTGRMIPNIEAVVDGLGLDLVLAAYNGAKVVDRRAAGRSVLEHRPVSAERAEPILRLAAAHGWLLNFYHEDRLLALPNEEMRSRIDVYHRRGGTSYEFVDEAELLGLDPTKLIIVADPSDHPAIEPVVRPSLEGLSTVRTDPEYLEIMAPDVHKGTAMLTLADHFGVAVDECLAIGDSGNDIEMLETAGVGVAVGNARDDVKAVADVVVEITNEDGAVAHVIETFILGG